MTSSEPILLVQGLKTYFYTFAGIVKAVDGISLQINKGETLGLVGESGSGKTVTAQSIMRIVPTPQLTEVIMRHQPVSKNYALTKATELLHSVGIADPEIRINQYPHELSGGTKQRIAIARALSCEPSLILADEPTTALDVTIQAQILELLKELKQKLNVAMVLITHDMGIVADTCDRVTVLYAGQVCETGTTEQVFENPKHPYTEALLSSVPSLALRKEKLSVIPGNVPNLVQPPSGCRFHPRCSYAQQICVDKDPGLESIGDDRLVHCHRWRELDLKSAVAS